MWKCYMETLCENVGKAQKYYNCINSRKFNINVKHHIYLNLRPHFDYSPVRSPSFKLTENF